MKMLLVLFDKQGQILLCRNPSGYSVPTNGAEVDEGFGFGSPQEENRWFWENCGLLVYRRYICFYMDYCAAVFELYGEGNVGKEFIWMDSGSLDKFIVGNSLTVLLKAVVTEKQDAFSSKIPLLHNYTADRIMKRIDNFPSEVSGIFAFLNEQSNAVDVHVTRRQLPQEMQEKIKNTYLKQWETYGTGKDILRIYETVERLKDFFMVLADADWLMETIEAVGGKVPEGSMDSWLLMRRIYYFRRVLGRFLAGDNN